MRLISIPAILFSGLLALSFSLTADAVPTISGRVTRSADASAVSGAVVTAFVLINPIQNANTTTNANGDFVLNVPGVGNYHVRVSANGLVEEFWDNVRDFGAATPVVTTADVSGIDFALDAFGSISGLVRRSGDLQALAGVSVAAETSPGSTFDSALSGADGSYALQVPSGAYRLRTSNEIGRVDQLHAGIACPYSQCDPGSATLVSVAAGQSITGIDFTLSPGAILAGQVQANAAPPTSSTAVSVYNNAGSLITSVSVPPDGIWQMGAGLLPGSYRASAGPGFGDSYGSELWQEHACGGVFQDQCDPLLGDSIAVAGPGVVGNIDFSLVRVVASLGGNIKRNADQSPIESASIDVLDGNGQFIVNTLSDANGDWIVTPLPPGTYRVRVNPLPPLLGEVWPGVQCQFGICSGALNIALSAGEDRGGLDFALAELGTLSVTVRNADTTQSMPASEMRVLFSGASQAQTLGGNVIPVLNGGAVRFAVTGGSCGPAGNRVCMAERWPDDACALFDCDLAAGQSITVPKGSASTTEISLNSGARISGTVRSAVDASVLADIGIELYDSSGDQVHSSRSAADGSYVLDGLGVGPYFLRTAAPSGYLDQLHAGIPCPMGRCNLVNGTALAPVPGGQLNNVDFSLPRGGAISGRLREFGIDRPIVGADVEVFDSNGVLAVQTSSVAQGLFLTPALPSGDYYLRAKSAQHEATLYINVPCPDPGCDPTTGTPIAVAAPTTQGGLVLTLNRLSGSPLVGPVVYLNRCIGGCTVSFGVNNAVANTSIIIQGTRNLAAFPFGDAAFDSVERCVRSVLAPYFLAITTTDPGNVPHKELMIAGSQQQGGFGTGQIFGVASALECAPIPSAIAFVFPETIGNDLKFICEVTVHELGHLLGLEHELHAPDVMSYGTVPQMQIMTDFDSACGTGQTAPCTCGGSTQNTHVKMTDWLGIDRMFQNGFGDTPFPLPQSADFSPANTSGMTCGTRTDRITPIPAAFWIDGPAFSPYE